MLTDKSDQVAENLDGHGSLPEHRRAEHLLYLLMDNPTNLQELLHLELHPAITHCLTAFPLAVAIVAPE